MRTSEDCIADCMYRCCRREAVRTYSADTEVHSDCILCCFDTVRTADCSDYTADSVRCRDTDRNRTATAERRCSDSDFDSADTAEHFQSDLHCLPYFDCCCRKYNHRTVCCRSAAEHSEPVLPVFRVRKRELSVPCSYYCFVRAFR